MKDVAIGLLIFSACFSLVNCLLADNETIRLLLLVSAQTSVILAICILNINKNR